MPWAIQGIFYMALFSQHQKVNKNQVGLQQTRFYIYRMNKDYEK